MVNESYFTGKLNLQIRAPWSSILLYVKLSLLFFGKYTIKYLRIFHMRYETFAYSGQHYKFCVHTLGTKKPKPMDGHDTWYLEYLTKEFICMKSIYYFINFLQSGLVCIYLKCILRTGCISRIKDIISIYLHTN